MCNHYRKAPAAVDFAVARVPRLRIPAPLGEIPEHTFPKYPAPIVLIEDGAPILSALRWGIDRFIGDGKTKPVTNARNDKLLGRTWKTCTESRRCLIPATGYFEPGLGPVGARGELLFTVKDRPAFFFAGLWDTNHDSGRAFTMVTTEPNDYVRPYHDRMPVVLDDADALAWLGDQPLAPDQLAHLCRGLPSEALAHEEIAARPRTPLTIKRPARKSNSDEDLRLL